MSGDRRWRAALAEHQRTVGAFVDMCARIPRDEWNRPPSAGVWSAAEVTLHVCRAYELARDGATGGELMRLRVSPRRARLLRTVLLPFLLATGRLPRGVSAPREAVPDAAEARGLTQHVAAVRLAHAAEAAADALRAAARERPSTRLTHAYFGDFSPLVALRFLSVHTRHHHRDLAERWPGGSAS